MERESRERRTPTTPRRRRRRRPLPPSQQVAIEGCCHGDLDRIYETVTAIQAADGRRVDLLLICGDFQAVRNADDLLCLACPPKYRALKNFHKYYSGAAVAPVPTVFIGGNHEASNHLAELALGGWAAPSIFYLGDAGVVTFGGLRIAGLSGIYNERHYRAGRYERPPYDASTIRSAYHVRALDVHRLARLTGPIDIFLSHDWPAGIAGHGDRESLLRRKPFLAREVADGSLGSPPAAGLLASLRPAHWFAAHMHTKFAAVVPHPASGGARGDGRAPVTRFLALDKCLPGRPFLQVLDIEPAGGVPAGPLRLAHDAQWLAILAETHALHSTSPRPPPLPADAPPPAQATVDRVVAAVTAARGSLDVPPNFQVTAAPPPPGADPAGRGGRMPEARRSPQTVELLRVLGLEYNLDAAAGGGRGGGVGGGGDHHHRHHHAEPPRAATAVDAIVAAAARVAALGVVVPPGGAAGDGGGGDAASGDAAPPTVDPNAIDLDDI